MKNGIELIQYRLNELGYFDDENITVDDYIDDVMDLMYEYKISIEEVEDLFTYDCYGVKRYLADDSDGIHIEEVTE